MMPPPAFATPALDFDDMLLLGRCLVLLGGSVEILCDKLGCDPDDDQTALALRAARAALAFDYANNVPPEEQQRIAQLLHSEQMEPGHG
jgi:hypothetical protein